MTKFDIERSKNMKAILLAGGYATRLYPLTINTPKPLLEINGRTILDYICDDLYKIDEVDEIIVVTNHKYAQCFEDWSKSKEGVKPITVIDDGTISNDDRLGAIGDIKFVIDKLEIDDDLIIFAGDSFYTDSMVDFYKYYKSTKKDCVVTKKVDDLELLKRCGVAKIDKYNKIVDFEEKPTLPKSNIIGFAMYIYTRHTVGMFDTYLNDGNNPDQPGRFLGWLYKKKDVHAYIYEGDFYDIGTLESLEEVREKFEQVIELENA